MQQEVFDSFFPAICGCCQNVASGEKVGEVTIPWRCQRAQGVASSNPCLKEAVLGQECTCFYLDIKSAQSHHKKFEKLSSPVRRKNEQAMPPGTVTVCLFAALVVVLVS